MKIDSMRKIDYWIGVPLTFLLSLLFFIARLGRKKTSVIPKRLLFIELSEMGSAIIVDPALRKAKQHFNAELFFLIFAKNKASLQLLNTVPNENIFTVRENNLFVFALDVVKYIFWARQKKIDAVFDLELFSRATAILSALSGAKNRVGYYAYHNEGLYRGNLLTHPVGYNPHIHMAKNFIALVNALISNDHDLPYSKTLISDDEIKLTQAKVDPMLQTKVKEKIQSLCPHFDETKNRIVLINPNASDLLPQRRWPPEHFKLLIQNILTAYADVIVLITGAPSERAEAEILQQQVNAPRCINFAGHSKFNELVPLYSIASLMVTNDSGPGHFAAVTPLRTIVLFGPETPKLYSSLGNSVPIYLGLACSPCVSAANHRKTPCTNNLCLKLMPPQRVMVEVHRALNENK
jgi:ADP-heptose:LPS heptosyltransferase